MEMVFKGEKEKSPAANKTKVSHVLAWNDDGIYKHNYRMYSCMLVVVGLHDRCL